MKHFYTCMRTLAVGLMTLASTTALGAVKVTLTPDNSAPVTKLSGTYTITFPEYETDGVVAYMNTRLDLTDPSGNMKRLKLTKPEGTTNVLTFSIEPAITASGVYNFVIDSGGLENVTTGAELGEVSFSYTVEAPEVPEHVITPTPGKTLKRLMGAVTITFTTLEDDGVSVNAQSMAEVTDPEGGEHSYRLMNGDAPNQVVFNISDVFETNGFYTVSIPAGAITNEADGQAIKAMEWTYTVDTEVVLPVYTVTPSIDEPMDKLEGAYSVTLNQQESVNWDGLSPCRVYVYDDKAGEPSAFPSSYYSASCSGNTVSFEVSPAITKGGKYYLNIAGFLNDNDDEIPEIYIPFTITGNAYVPDTPVDPGTGADWTYEITPEPGTVKDLSERIFIYFPNITELNNFACFVRIQGPDYDNPYATRFINYGRVLDDGSDEGDGGAPGPWSLLATPPTTPPAWNWGYIDVPASVPVTDGEWTFTIKAGEFYIDDDSDDSEYNPQIVFSYTVSGSSGVIATWGEDAGYTIYRLNGTAVSVDGNAESVRALEPGLYIINGKTYRIR